MHSVAAAVGAWLDAGDDPVVVRAPLVEGAGGAGPAEVLAFGPGGDCAGALLGGAVDDTAARLAGQVRSSHQRQVATVTLSDHDARVCGLISGCLVTLVADRAAALPFDWQGGRTPAVFAGPLGEGGPVMSVTGDHAGTSVADTAQWMLRSGRSGGCLVDHTSLVEVYVPTVAMVVVGGSQVAAALADQATLLGWLVEVAADEPAALAALGRLGHGDAIVVLSHDPAVDTPVLAAALRATVGYVGALGSRRIQARRRERLLAAGETADVLGAIHGPAGLDVGANTAAEIAVSICAEILATRAGRTPLSLRDTSGPIHL